MLIPLGAQEIGEIRAVQASHTCDQRALLGRLRHRPPFNCAWQLANVFYVATTRTFLPVIPVLQVVFGYQAFGRKGGGFVGRRNFRTNDGSVALGFVTAAAGLFIL